MNPEQSPDAFPFLLEAVVGASIGALIAIIASRFGKRPIKFFPDLLLGAVGYVGGVALTPHIPWHQNTIQYRVGAAVVRATSRHFQYPYRVGFVIAVLAPLLYEVARFFFEKKAQVKPRS
jgi:hypothetical protein